MGGLFSYLANTDIDRENQEKEFQAKIVEYQKQIDDFNKQYEENLIERKKKIDEIYKERQKIIKERIEELEYIDQRYQELKDQRKCINNRASAYVCTILFNYYSQNVGNFDDISTFSGCEFQDELLRVYDQVIFPPKDDEVNKLVYFQLCQISPLLPLLYPTGQLDSSLYENMPDDPVQFAATINGYIKTYIRSNLRRYTFNVCFSNCYEHMYSLNEKQIKTYDEACEKYRESVKECLTNESFIAETYSFLKQFTSIDDMMRIKMLSAKSNKGISNKVPKRLPKYYPKICPKYELWESILMIVNTLCYNYGSIRNEFGQMIEGKDGASLPSNASGGGKCFFIPDKCIKACFEQYFDMNPKHVWNYTGTDFINTLDGSLNVNVESITGTDKNEEWMKNLTVCSQIEAINKNPTTLIGTLKYINPTRKYTYQLMNDEACPEESFQLPKMSADMSNTFKNDLLFNLTTSLMSKSEDTIKYSIYNTNYKYFMYSTDYINTAPESFELINNISPTSQFVYNMLLVNGLKWNMILPIDNTMTMSKINKRCEDLVGENYEPQYIWAGNETQAKHNQKQITTTGFDMLYAQPIKKNMTWTPEYGYYTWLSDNSQFINKSNQPKKDGNNLFDV